MILTERQIEVIEYKTDFDIIGYDEYHLEFMNRYDDDGTVYELDTAGLNTPFEIIKRLQNF
jgi:hypothetical protein